MSEIQVLVILLVAISSGISFYLGRKEGINCTVDFLEEQGILEFDE